jgi:hypothetical protein
MAVSLRSVTATVTRDAGGARCAAAASAGERTWVPTSQPMTAVARAMAVVAATTRGGPERGNGMRTAQPFPVPAWMTAAYLVRASSA